MQVEIDTLVHRYAFWPIGVEGRGNVENFVIDTITL